MNKYKFTSVLLAMLCIAFCAQAQDWLSDIEYFNKSSGTLLNDALVGKKVLVEALNSEICCLTTGV